jgi:hypothetical protein
VIRANESLSAMLDPQPTTHAFGAWFAAHPGGLL